MTSSRTGGSAPIVIGSWTAAREAYRSKHLRQGLYDGGVVMDNVLINLHGTDHRDRRRVENPLFRRDTLFAYEREAFPEVLWARLEADVVDGRFELLSFGHGVMLELAAVNAGIDLDIGDHTAVADLSEQLKLFIDGARILHYTGDKAAKEREVEAALAAFTAQFVEPAASRRGTLLDAGDEPPRDIVSVLLANQEGLDIDHSTLVRETAFFLLTGASTSAATMTMTLHNIFEWIVAHPDDEERLLQDAPFVQRCILESLRLEPISPIAARWATSDFEVSDGTQVHAGDRVHIDMRQANRDPLVWGPDADEFLPDRNVPADIPRAGVSFGHGMHHCIGQELAVGIEPDGQSGFDQRLFGLVGTVVQELLARGIRPDPDDPPVADSATQRQTFARYPVVVGSSAMLDPTPRDPQENQ